MSWQRYLSTLLGFDSEATATILGIYLGGLALGIALFACADGVIAARSATERRALCCSSTVPLKATIGTLALFLFPSSFAAVQRLAAVMRTPLRASGFSPMFS